jgi:hypothetical protein
MTTIYSDGDADPGALAGHTIAVVGYGNQGRSWALNLRDSGLDPQVCVRADASREQAEADGFAASDISLASDADAVCVLVPDDAIPSLPLSRPEDGLTIVASGYSLAFDRFAPPGDLGMVAPRMLGPEVRRCYMEGAGFITAVGVERDATGRALARTLAVASALGGLREGAIALTPMQEAVLARPSSPRCSSTGFRSRRSSPSSSCPARSSAPTACCAGRASRSSSSTTPRPASTASCRAGAPTTGSTSIRSCASSSRRSPAGASPTSGTPSRRRGIRGSPS